MVGRVRAGNVDVQLKLVQDLDAKGEGARQVRARGTSPAGPRVDIKVGVETGDAKPMDPAAVYAAGGKSSRSDLEKIPLQAQGSAPPPGGGVLGFLLADKAGASAQPKSADPADGLEPLRAFIGQKVRITYWDRESFGSLGEAAKAHDVSDAEALLLGVEGGELKLKNLEFNKEQTLSTEYWAIARVTVDSDDGRAVPLRDPSYADHFMD